VLKRDTASAGCPAGILRHRLGEIGWMVHQPAAVTQNGPARRVTCGKEGPLLNSPRDVDDVGQGQAGFVVDDDHEKYATPVRSLEAAAMCG
jgi:hypothetical protein